MTDVDRIQVGGGWTRDAIPADYIASMYQDQALKALEASLAFCRRVEAEMAKGKGKGSKHGMGGKKGC